MTNKKILVVATTDNMIWQFLIPHIKHMQQLGNNVECVCAKTGFWFDELKDKYGFIMHEINFARNPFKPANIKAYKTLKQLHIQNHYDVIYCQQPVGGMMGRLLGKKFKIPTIYTAHGFHFFKGCSIVNKLIYKPVEKWLSKYTDVLITINNEDYENAKKMKAKKVFKINGIGMEFNKYAPLTETREEIRKSVGLKDNEFVIVTVAEFIKRKNYDTMLKSIKELKDRGIKVKYLICGRGKEEENIKKLVNQLNIEDEVKLLGYRKDINRILSCADVFYLASFQEGLTLSVIEAMSFGLPCVVSNIRGNRDLIVEDKGGFVAEPKDYQGFATKLEQLLTNKDLRDEMGKFNIEQSKQYTVEKVKEQLEKIYNEVQ